VHFWLSVANNFHSYSLFIGKGKGHPITGHKGPEDEWRYSSTLPSTSALDGQVGGQRHTSAALPPVKRHDTHCIRGCVGPTAGLEGCENVAPHLDSIPGPSSP
jgi:hypothetical protein